jgi:hypothetical protein
MLTGVNPHGNGPRQTVCSYPSRPGTSPTRAYTLNGVRQLFQQDAPGRTLCRMTLATQR